MMGVVVGVNALAHDGSVVVLDGDGTLLHWAEEERYRRVKRGEFVSPPGLVDLALAEAGVGHEDVEVVAFAEVHALRERLPMEVRGDAPQHGYDRLHATVERNLLARFPRLVRSCKVRHHLCHAASSYYPAGLNDAAVLTVDAKGEHESAATWLAEGSVLRPLRSLLLPVSLGYLYTRIATWAGLRGAEREGKLMALAATGDSAESERFRRLFFGPERGMSLRMANPLCHVPCTREAWSAYCNDVLGPPRAPDQPLTSRERDVAACLQQVTEEILLSMTQEVLAETGRSALCLAGGVFMNSVANGRIARESGAKTVFVPPWPNDVGLALGAALVALGGRCSMPPGLAYAGTGIGPEEADEALAAAGLVADRVEDPVAAVADLVAAGRIVGWADGRLEVGPRALGARSILARPDDPVIAERLNAQIKFRERWRPFAPAVLPRECKRLFGRDIESPFMSFVHTVTDEGARCLAGTVHLDGTVRVQTVGEAGNSRFHRLLDLVARRTGTAAVLNTSFNVQGEPIVRTARQAVADFVDTPMDALFVGGRLVLQRSKPPAAGRVVRAAELPGRVHPEVARRLAGASALLLWLDPRLALEQEARLRAAGADVRSRRLDPEALNDLATPTEVTVIGLSCYLPYAAEHLPRVVRAIRSTPGLYVIDRDLACVPGSALTPAGPPDDVSELEFQWLNPRKEGS